MHLEECNNKKRIPHRVRQLATFEPRDHWSLLLTSTRDKACPRHGLLCLPRTLNSALSLSLSHSLSHSHSDLTLPSHCYCFTSALCLTVFVVVPLLECLVCITLGVALVSPFSLPLHLLCLVSSRPVCLSVSLSASRPLLRSSSKRGLF